MVIPGMAAVSEVEQALLAASDPGLSPEDIAVIGRDRKELTGRFCRRCGYCLPCPQGIPVNTLISAELFLKRAGWSRADAKYLQMLEDAAANCQQCGECELRCPYNLPPASMVRPTALRAAEKVRAEIARRVQPG